MSGQTPDQNEPQATPLGIYDRPQYTPITSIEVAALVVSVVWLVISLVLVLRTPTEGESGFDGMRFIITMLTIFLPVGMIWVAATAARSNRVMREESRRLQAAIDGIRQSYVAQLQRGSLPTEPSVARKLDEIAAAAKKTETALATFSTRREPVSSPPPVNDPIVEDANQGSLALGTPADELVPPLATEDMIRALNFPETAEDEVGFAALRRALRDRRVAKLVQASQDILTLLSQDGIYMDDLRPDMSRPEIWRQFAKGARGRTIAPLGGVRDRSSLALTAGRMKQDPIFRDTAHHFLRLFDRMIVDFEPGASDAELTAMSETRTARAFMLLGRVAGTFD